MSPRAPVTLVADLGGSSFRLALFGPGGEERARVQHALTLEAEADPALWLAEFAALAAEALAAAGEPRVAAIAITAFTRTEIYLDREGRVVRPAITFRDARAVAEAAAIDSRLGARGVVTAFSPLARLAWLRRHEPRHFARIAQILQPKDFIAFHLTRVAASDPASNAPLVGETRRYLSDRFAAAEFDVGLFPALRAPGTTLGIVRDGLPGALARLAGARVVVGAMDTWAATLGLGAHHPGGAYNLSGTTEVNGLMLAAPARADGLLGVAWDDGLFHLGGPSQAGADCLVWFARLMNISPAEAVAAASAVAADAAVPLFMPYLAGERVPFWDPDLRGGFAGLARDSSAAMLARAVMEGVAFHDRLVFARAIAASGVTPAEILVGGGGASADLWCQIKADAWGLDLARPAIEEAGLRGALILAGGKPPTPRIDRFKPDAASHAALDRRYTRFLDEISRMRAPHPNLPPQGGKGHSVIERSIVAGHG